MQSVDPISNLDELKRFKEYYQFKKPNSRNNLLIITGLNTALRISDLLKLTWQDVYDFEQEKYKYKCYLYLNEKKTGKIACHSMRKTFGYHASKQGVLQSLLVDLFNHSSYNVTRHYIGLEQDDKDEVFKNINV